LDLYGSRKDRLNHTGIIMENRYCENFNVRFRDELLNGKIFYSLKKAQTIIEQWGKHYNTAYCPWLSPASFRGHRPGGPRASHALTFKQDHLNRADQKLLIDKN